MKPVLCFSSNRTHEIALKKCNNWKRLLSLKDNWLTSLYKTCWPFTRLQNSLQTNENQMPLKCLFLFFLSFLFLKETSPSTTDQGLNAKTDVNRPTPSAWLALSKVNAGCIYWEQPCTVPLETYLYSNCAGEIKEAACMELFRIMNL